MAVQFKDVGTAAGERTVNIKDLLKVSPAYGRSATQGLNAAADQIHVWTGTSWRKYWYNTTIASWSLEGEQGETQHTLKNGDTFFFLRSSRGVGTVTLSGEVNVSLPQAEYDLTARAYHFVGYPWPVDFAVDDFKNCISPIYGRTTAQGLNAAADQIHVWTGTSWEKYYYNTTVSGFVKDGESEITPKKIPAGEGVFLLRSSRGAAKLTFTKPTGL